MTDAPDLGTRPAVVFALTFVVAFCSIAYELVYSELLTVLFGGTVVRYSVTIGLYLFSLGVGAFLFAYLSAEPEEFFRLELFLAVAGPLGFVFVVLVNSVPPSLVEVPRGLAVVVSHLPILVVGVLSGLEVPFLAALLDRTRGENRPGSGGGLARLAGAAGRGSRRAAVATLGVLFSVDRRQPGDADATADDPGAVDRDDGFSQVLGVDYVGSLAGTVVYALVLYPELGLIPSVFVLGLLNALAALVVWLGLTGGVDATVSGEGLRTGSRVLVVVCLLVSTVYAGAVVADDRVERELTELYLESRIEGEYPSENVAVDVVEYRRTRYQNVLLYDRTWTGDPERWEHPRRERCLRLDLHRQLCESWAESYHRGLVDVPATVRGGLDDDRVLLVGGGDWIAADRLRAYDATVDMVDVDGEFQSYARDHPYFRQYHDDAHEYDRLSVTVEDAYAHLAETDRSYDLVLLDLPGIRSDDLLRLYSREFYTLVGDRLAPGGLVATWGYSPQSFAEHHHTYMNTVRSAGFTRYLQYHAYADRDDDGDPERGERFYLFSRGATPRLDAAGADSAYVRRYADRYDRARWRPTPTYVGVPVNSVFDPNYEMVVDYR
jgi:spermidine synthase